MYENVHNVSFMRKSGSLLLLKKFYPCTRIRLTMQWQISLDVYSFYT